MAAFVVSWFVGFTTLGFFVAMFWNRLFLGYSVDQYFMSVIVLSLVIVSMKACRCGAGHWMGGKHHESGPMKMDQSMDNLSM